MSAEEKGTARCGVSRSSRPEQRPVSEADAKEGVRRVNEVRSGDAGMRTGTGKRKGSVSASGGSENSKSMETVMKTYLAKVGEIKREHIVLDASEMPVGRLAVKIAWRAFSHQYRLYDKSPQRLDWMGC